MVNPLTITTTTTTTSTSLPLSATKNASKNGDDDDDCIIWGEDSSVPKPSLCDSPDPDDDEEESSSVTPCRNGAHPSTSLIHDNKSPSTSEVKKRDQRSDGEIATMWSRLEQSVQAGENDPNDDGTTSLPAAASSDTPLRGNRGNSFTAIPQGMEGNASSVPQENRYGLVKTRRRRGDRQRPRPVSLSAPRRPNNLLSDNNSNNNNNDVETQSKRRMSSDDAFADLLEHLKTPDRDETMPPPQKARKSLPSIPSSSNNNNNFPPSREDSPIDVTKTNKPATNEASPDPFGPFPDIDFEALDRSISTMTQINNLSQKSNDMSATTASLQQSSQSNPLSAPSNPLASQHRVAPLAQADQAQGISTVQQNDAQSTIAAHEAPMHEQQQPNGESIHNTSVPSGSAQFENEEDDPFGDFPMIDLEMIDKKIEQAKASPQQARPPPSAPVHDDDGDPFGDFPDVDFEMLDQQVAAAAAAHPPSNDDGLSRYRVVQVSADIANFTKTLHVARWKDDMCNEFEDRLAIHQERGAPYPKQTCWAVDGLIYLRGQWCHTEVYEGDFVHVYSLFGRSSTSRLPLMLDTSSDPKMDDLVLIMHPESMLIPTTISEATSCPRRAVLKTRIGSSGSSQALLLGTLRHRFFEETLQNIDFSPKAVRDRINLIVREASEDIVGCPGTTSHAVQTELHKVVPQVKKFVNDYTSFLQPQRKSLARLDSNGAHAPLFVRANNVYAIEEAINSPEMGIRGNIDAVLHATVADNLIESPTEALLAVELKTGHRQSMDPSHMAQLTLYNLMLQARYGSAQTIDTAKSNRASRASMLLYLNADSVKTANISPSVLEAKMLLGQRNTVASKQKQSTELRGVELKFENDSKWPTVEILPPQAPALPPVENASMCERCYMNRECTLYASLEEKCGQNGHTSRPNLGLLQQFTGHLSQAELGYFATWDRLIDFEASAVVRPVATKWLRSSAELEASTKRSVSSLIIKKVEANSQPLSGKAPMMFVIFERSPNADHQVPISSLGLASDSHTIISIDDVTAGNGKRYRKAAMHLARGIVHQSSDSEITLRVSESDVRRLQRILVEFDGDSTPTFRLDRDEVATGLTTLRRNIINLLTGDKSSGALESPVSKRLPKLREEILQLKEPVFDKTGMQSMFSPPPSKTIPKVKGLDMEEMFMDFHDMNDDQKHAVEKVMSAQNYTLVQGMPGTGKTTLISFLVRLLVAHGKRILLTSYTHSAVDNLLLKLIKTGITEKQNDGTRAVLRAGDASKCHEGVRDLLISTVANEKEGVGADGSATAESIRHCVRRARVVGVTALSIPNSNLLGGETFDVVIVDEAGQISQPAIIGALMAADSFILVGDHMQLPPLVSSDLAEKGGFGISMLKRLAEAHPQHVAQLTFQYRMAEDICQISNDIVYEGKLKCATDSVRWRKLQLSGFPENIIPGVYSRVIDPKRTVVFLDTDQRKQGTSEIVPLESNGDRQEGGSLVNKTEATMVERILHYLILCGVAPSSIGVICPFNAQLTLLESSLQVSKFRQQGLECSTIDRYQGRDKPVIILSFVRSNAKGRVGRILADFRRLNVAVSRAECKLIMVGSFSTLHTGSEAIRPALDKLSATDKVIRVSE